MATHGATIQRLQTALDYDPLTQAHSRLYFFAALRQEVARFGRDAHSSDGKGFAVGILDVDHFKQINDHHGHQYGDEVLIRVTKEAHRLLRREGDVFGRYGGDEFVFLLPQTPIEAARALAEKLREAVETLLLPEGAIPITLSMGLAACPDQGACVDSLLQAADAALYRAKRNRNSVRVAGEV